MAALLQFLIALIFLQVFLNAFVIAFTLPSSSLRLAILPIIVICVYQVLPICLEATGRMIWAALLGAHSISFLFQYLDTALLSKWSTETCGPTARRKQRFVQDQNVQMTIWARLRFGYHAAVSTRNIGTPFEVPGIPHFSTKDPNYVPSKATFLREKAMLLLSCYLILDIMTLASQPDQNPVLYNTSRVSWMNSSNLSMEQLITRSASVLGFWISLYCIIQAYMGSVAFLSVALGFSQVESWPPGFGPISEAYTVRRFWG